MLITRYDPVLPAGVSRTRMLNGKVRGNTAGFTQKLTVICQWASIEEIDEVRRQYFTDFNNMDDVTGKFVLDGEPSIEDVVTPDHYIKNSTMTGSAWYDTNSGVTPGVTGTRGTLASV